MGDHAKRRRKLLARPLLAAGVGLAAAIYGACGGSSTPLVVGNLKLPPTCDAGICLPDGGQDGGNGTVCLCPADGG